MRETLTVIENAPAIAPRDRAKRLDAALRNALDALRKTLTGSDTYPGGAYPLSPQEKLWTTLYHAASDVSSYHERRERVLETKLCELLGKVSLTEAERRDVFSTLFGRAAKGRDAQALSECERDMIAQYRDMDDAGRQMIRTLFRRLAQSSSSDTEDDVLAERQRVSQ